MDRNNLQSTEKSPVQATTGRTSRLFFIDHLRAALVILVVLHHLALVYGGIPPFYYFEPPINDPLAGLIALAFVLLNQAWFMGAFFLLAGYFTPGSYDRKGPSSFLKSRLLRLGIPLILFIIHIPIIVLLAVALRGIELAALLKFGMMALIVVPTCFAAAFIIRKIPFALRVL